MATALLIKDRWGSDRRTVKKYLRNLFEAGLLKEDAQHPWVFYYVPEVVIAALIAEKQLLKGEYHD